MDRNFPKTAMQLTKQFLAGVILVCLNLGVTLHAAELNQFDAQYTAFRFGKDLGTASLQLESLGRQRYRLSYESKVSMFFLSDKRNLVKSTERDVCQYLI